MLCFYWAKFAFRRICIYVFCCSLVSFDYFRDMKLFSLDDMKGEAGLMLCISGTCEALINGKAYFIERGFLCVKTPIIHVYPMKQSADYRVITIMDELSVFYALVRGIFDIVVRMGVAESPCLMLSEEDMDHFIKRYKLIEEKRQEMVVCGNEEDKRLLAAFIHLQEQDMILRFILRYRKSKGHVSAVSVSRNKDIAYRFAFSVNQQCDKVRSVGHYASQLGLSLSHFTRLVKAELGHTPSELIQMVTIAKAKLLLSQPDNSVKDVATALNFPEQFTFRKYFKAHTGISPTVWRERGVD